MLGFDVVFEQRDVPGGGTTGDILFLSAGGYHHHLGFNTWKTRGGEPQPDGVAGLHHVAIRYPTRAALVDALRGLREVEWPIRQATDHGTHLAIYISHPDSYFEHLIEQRNCRRLQQGESVTTGLGALTQLVRSLTLAFLASPCSIASCRPCRRARGRSCRAPLPRPS
ncbi:MAG: catechol 2,3-dioxygenase, partial [Gaiellales bacterium]|nr:catechol 2,3-dioxygenase [Gaiellales bacterium]